MEYRKLREQQTYDVQYLSGQENTDPDIRGLLLDESEQAFSDLLSCRLKESEGEVLEIGCGRAHFSILAAKAGVAITAVDISKEAIKAAQNAANLAGVADRINFAQMDCEAMSLPDRSMALVINHEVFSSVDIEKALSEIARVLVSGGRVISMETFGHNPLFNIKRWANVLLGKRTRWAATHIWRKECFQLAERYFTDIRVVHFHLFSPLVIPLRHFLPRRFCVSIINAVSRVDRVLLRKAPFKRLAFKVVFEMTRK